MKRLLPVVSGLALVVLGVLTTLENYADAVPQRIGRVASPYYDIDQRLDVSGGEPGWLGRKIVQKKCGFAFIAHDGDTSFATTFKFLSDSLYDSWSDRWSGTPKRIRGTTGIIPNVVGTAGYMTWATLKTLDQKDFEIGMHGDSNARTGPELVGFSYNFMDSVLAGDQDSMVVHGLDTARVYIRPNWRMNEGQEYLLEKNGFSGGITLAEPNNYVEANLASNEVHAMGTNTDAAIPILMNDTQGNNWCYQGYGRIQNRWNVGTRQSWDNTAADTSTVRVREIMDTAVHMGCMAALTFHNFAGLGNIGMDADSLRAIMLYADSLLALYPDCESLTASQMIARGTGRVIGELINTNGFDLQYEHGSFLATGRGLSGDADSLAPLLYPFNNSYYLSSNYTPFSVANDSSFKSVDADTIRGAFVRQDGDESNLTYGMSGPGRHVLVGAIGYLGTGAPLRSFQLMLPPIFVTGVDGQYVNVTVQVASPDTSTDGYLACRFYQYHEAQEDFINGSTSSMPFAAATGDYFDVLEGENPRAARTRLQSTSFADTVVANDIVGGTDHWVTSANNAEMFRFNIPSLLPIIMDDTNYGLDNEGAGTAAVFDASFGANYVTIGSTQLNELPLLDTPMHWETYTYKVPINSQTDIIVGQCHLETNGTKFSDRNGDTTPPWFISWVSAVAPQ